MALLLKVEVIAWQCEACKWLWLSRGKKIPKQCPNRECRQRLQIPERASRSSGQTEYPEVPNLAPLEKRSTGSKSQVEHSISNREVAGSNPAGRSKIKRMDVAEFMKLSKSDQMRAQREGKF
jgi:hypothetical protein